MATSSLPGCDICQGRDAAHEVNGCPVCIGCLRTRTLVRAWQDGKARKAAYAAAAAAASELERAPQH